MKAKNLRLFDGYGVEVEYMIVGSDSLDVAPVSDELLRVLAGSGPGVPPNDAELNGITVSNELVLHVVELCNSCPAPSLSPLGPSFQRAVERINTVLEGYGARLMPTAMHPWMDPAAETSIWPHDYSEVYRAYDRIFDCRRHGWANVQSSQLNISFSGDEEFGALHAACRFVMPLLPALAASSPVAEARVTGFLDTRLVHYRTNQAAVPSVAGSVIPEPVYAEDAYRETVLERMYRDMEGRDPDGVLRYEWLNSRGAIPRFDRSAVEIRVMDNQERPAADMAVAALAAGAIRLVLSGRWTDPADIASWPTERLAAMLESAVRSGEDALIEDGEYLEALGLKVKSAAAERVWRHLAEEASLPAEAFGPLEVIFGRGTLAKRILAALGPDADRSRLKKVYSRLCDCLAEGSAFVP